LIQLPMGFIQMDDNYTCHLMGSMCSESTFATQRFESYGLHSIKRSRSISFQRLHNRMYRLSALAGRRDPNAASLHSCYLAQYFHVDVDTEIFHSQEKLSSTLSKRSSSPSKTHSLLMPYTSTCDQARKFSSSELSLINNI
jgi:hypothetical protein